MHIISVKSSVNLINLNGFLLQSTLLTTSNTNDKLVLSKYFL